MSHRRSVVVVVASVGAAVALGGALGLGLSEDPGTSPSFASGPSSAGHSNAQVGSAGAIPGSRPGTNSAPTAGSSAQGRNEDDAGIEVIPATPGETPDGLPGLTDPSTSAKALPRWDPPAESASARGRLVAGYPVRLLPAAPRARVLTSSVSPAGRQVQVALVAHRGQRSGAVLRFYRTTLVRAGFEEDRVIAVGGATAAAFTRGDSRVVVTIDPGRTRTYSLLATLTARA